jgi:signal transduction histidine kinase
MAHDLMTPLTAIRSFSEILLDNPDLPDGERNRFLGIVLEESERLHRHIKRVLEVPTETGRGDPVAAPHRSGCSGHGR